MSKKSAATEEHLPPEPHPNETLKYKLTKCVNAVVEKHLTCPICLDIVTDAHTNPECLHRYCGKCIKGSVQKCNNECPTCRVHIPTHRTLRKDTAFEEIKDALQEMMKIINEDATQPKSKTSDCPPNSINYESLPVFQQKEEICCHYGADSMPPWYYSESDDEYLLGSNYTPIHHQKDAMQDIVEIINEDHATQSRTDYPTNSVSYDSESESLPAFKQEESYFSRDEDSTLPGYYDKNDSEYKFSLGLSLRSTVDKSKTVHVHVPSQQDHCKKATSSYDHSPSHTVESLLSSSYHQSLRKDTLNDQRSWHVNNDIDSCEEMDGDIHPLPVKREEEENVKQPSQQITPFESHDTQDSDMLSSPLRQNQVSCSAKRSFDTSPSSIVQPPKKRIKKSFNERFEELKEFKKTHGHCNVPRRNNEYKSLGNWCSEIRKTHKGTRNNMTLTPSNKRDLERIGFKWTRQEKKK